VVTRGLNHALRDHRDQITIVQVIASERRKRRERRFFTTEVAELAEIGYFSVTSVVGTLCFPLYGLSPLSQRHDK